MMSHSLELDVNGSQKSQNGTVGEKGIAQTAASAQIRIPVTWPLIYILTAHWSGFLLISAAREMKSEKSEK